MMNQTSPIIEHGSEGQTFDDSIEQSFQSNGWCCFGHSCFGRTRSNDGEANGLLGDERETWLGERFRIAKEASEVLAGPKWKNFIRKIGKSINRRKMKKGQFQYDPQSYALNFQDDGVEDEDDGFLLGFSSRFTGSVRVDERHS